MAISARFRNMRSRRRRTSDGAPLDGFRAQHPHTCYHRSECPPRSAGGTERTRGAHGHRTALRGNRRRRAACPAARQRRGRHLLRAPDRALLAALPRPGARHARPRKIAARGGSLHHPAVRPRLAGVLGRARHRARAPARILRRRQHRPRVRARPPRARGKARPQRREPERPRREALRAGAHRTGLSHGAPVRRPQREGPRPRSWPRSPRPPSSLQGKTT